MAKTVVRFGLLAVCILAVSLRMTAGSLADGPVTITVTSVGDSVVAGESECPHATKCTLRRAIEKANSTAGVDAVVITFRGTLFLPANPATIALAGTALPVLTRPQATINGSAVDVIIDGSAIATDNTPGIRLAEANQAVMGVSIQHFTGTCIDVSGAKSQVGGDARTNEGVIVGDCKTGIAMRGGDGWLAGSLVGFLANGTPGEVTTGVRVTGNDVVLGKVDAEHDWGNRIGNAATGVAVGDGALVTPHTVIRGNTFGTSPASTPAPLAHAIDILAGADQAVIIGNAFAHVTAEAIVIRPPSAMLSNARHLIQGNTFADIGGLAIDLGANGERDANDAGDTDTGANGLLNHPVITKATIARLSGNVGTTCPACVVQVYRASHEPGGAIDYGTTPISSVTADATGSFALDVPGLDVGDWVTAIVTDSNGNTSEFGPSARVGSGIVQCGVTELKAGWNHAPYFGPNATPLGDSFPASGTSAGHVAAVYRLIDGSSSFLRWIAGAGFANTLLTLEPGESYFFLVDENLSLPGGFALTLPYPVDIFPGWNDIVYIGGAGDYRDAFGTAGTAIQDTYRFTTNGAHPAWENIGPAGTPAWARDFTEIVPCGAYEVFATSAATIFPLQP